MELEMEPVLEALGKIRTVLDDFSIAGCMA
jgi:hypothetical protein